MIYKHTNTGLKGAPKWGVKLNKGEEALSLSGGNDDFVVRKKGKPIKGNEPKRKGKRLDLNWIRFHKSEINYKDINEQGEEVDSNKSRVFFRFHSTKANAEKSELECIKEFGGTHQRYFIYDGIDKSEEELLEWAVTEPGLKDASGKITIEGAKLQKVV